MQRVSKAMALAGATGASILIAAAAQAAPPAQILEFKGAELGMSLQDWKALPFPGQSLIAVNPVCSDDPKSARVDMAISPAEKQAGVIACTYVYGAADGDGPRHPVPLDDHLTADHVLYKFRDGRLASISYQVSVDAFDDIVARLRAEAGAPAVIQRDQVKTAMGEKIPRVRMNWRTPTGSVLLTDPANRQNRLSVTLAAGSGAQT
jgi:hypothetical protein